MLHSPSQSDDALSGRSAAPRHNTPHIFVLANAAKVKVTVLQQEIWPQGDEQAAPIVDAFLERQHRQEGRKADILILPEGWLSSPRKVFDPLCSLPLAFLNKELPKCSFFPPKGGTLQ